MIYQLKNYKRDQAKIYSRILSANFSNLVSHLNRLSYI